MNGWRDPATETPPGDSWLIEDGCLRTRPKPRISEDLITSDSFADFELQFDWRISPKGNTGVKYRIQRAIFLDNTKVSRGEGGFEAMLGRELANPRSDRARMAPGATGQEYTISYEFQLIDDAGYPASSRAIRLHVDWGALLDASSHGESGAALRGVEPGADRFERRPRRTLDQRRQGARRVGKLRAGPRGNLQALGRRAGHPRHAAERQAERAALAAAPRCRGLV